MSRGVRVGDIVRLGSTEGLGDGLFLVLATFPKSINDLKVIRSDLRGDHWYARSAGCTLIARQNE